MVGEQGGITELALSVLGLWETGSYVLMGVRSLASNIWWGFHDCEVTQEMCIRSCYAGI